ncbi:VanZ family protein [Alkalicoccobacillus gibsonii]|uniref:VanZ family protein n=1 Tax=Alkalicoccobacillus gibsonii TaxID=79881 RepID=UPI001AED5C16|nr:VanZ family protein [Alkalicoccobacillus gibsonii]
MTADTIFSLIKDHFTTSLMGIIMLALLFSIAYFLVYKKLLRGTASISIKPTIVTFMLVGYILMVLGVTVFSRGSYYAGSIDLTLFSSYVEAWNEFSVKSWQFVILNIVMFLPLGILLPLLQDRFKHAAWTLAAAILFTLAIETFQYFTGFGVFEVDDLFNNTLGAIIGYGMTMSVLKVRNKRLWPTIGYLSPLLLTLLAFGIVFGTYSLKEFGNLSIAPTKKVNMNETTIILDVFFNGETDSATPVYQVSPYSHAEALEEVKELLINKNIDPHEINEDIYTETGVYTLQSEPYYSVWFEFKDGSYRYNEGLDFEDNVMPKDTDQEILIQKLSEFGITPLDQTNFHQLDTGRYEWTADLLEKDGQLIDGTLTVEYYSDDSIKSIEQSMITYDKVIDKRLKSEQKAFNQLMEGSFYPYAEHYDKIEIKELNVTYVLDSKGFYQPVYAFKSIVDGNELDLLIPAL